MAETSWNLLSSLKKVNEGNRDDYAMLVLNQPILCPSELVKSLWSKAKFHALADGGSNRWLEFIETQSAENLQLPDFISGDFDSLKPKAAEYFKNKGVSFIPTPDQDETDFSKALRCIDNALTANKIAVKWVLVLCENSGRFDQIAGNINTLHRSNNFIKSLPVILLSSQSITWVLTPGKHVIHISEEFINKQYSCGLIPFCGPTVITTSGLKWDLNNQISAFGDLVSTSNTYVADKVNITCDKYLIWTTEYNDIDK